MRSIYTHKQIKKSGRQRYCIAILHPSRLRGLLPDNHCYNTWTSRPVPDDGVHFPQ